ncbi:MAG: DUF5615 family PIN-like protein [Haloferacaceae archaeon]
MTRGPAGDRGSCRGGDGRLLLDAMLGKLATYLRMCGYDAAYALDRGVEDDDELLAVAREEGRLLLTRDRSLAERAAGERSANRGGRGRRVERDLDDAPGSVLLRGRDVIDQLRELRDAGFGLELADPPRRCGRCNGRLDRLGDDDTRPEHAPDDGPVWRCRDCGQHFWMGSHWDDVARRLDVVENG